MHHELERNAIVRTSYDSARNVMNRPAEQWEFFKRSIIIFVLNMIQDEDDVKKIENLNQELFLENQTWWNGKRYEIRTNSFFTLFKMF